MNFNIYLDDKAGKHLNRAAAQSKKTRNAVIREAVEHWIQHSARPAWPHTVMAFHGIKRLEPFESHRKGLRKPSEDPLA